MASYTIEQWLRGMVDFEVPDSTVRAILFNNAVEEGAEAYRVQERERDLCLADLLMWLSSASTVTSGEYISDGGWVQQKSNRNVADRSTLRQRAQALYAKWGSEKADSAIGSKVSIKSLY